MMRGSGAVVLSVLALTCTVESISSAHVSASNCSFDFSYPKQYVTYKVDTPPTIDGKLDEELWEEVGWTELFQDIQGPALPQPRFETRAKIRWDDSFLYVGAKLQEPDVWATITEHDKVIFQDNDFEVFVDAAGSNHYYKEFEVNAFASTWALCLDKPYMNGGHENSSRVLNPGWDMPSARAAVSVQGSINDPNGPPDEGWSVEIALPLKDLVYNNSKKMPKHGSYWRINFSRVEWKVKVVDGKYVKLGGPEDNWVWSPQFEIAMHMPERWGYLQFATGAVNGTGAKRDKRWGLRSVAMALYEAQVQYQKANHRFSSTVAALLEYDQYKVFAGQCSDIPVITTFADGAGYRANIVQGKWEAVLWNDRNLKLSLSKTDPGPEITIERRGATRT